MHFSHTIFLVFTNFSTISQTRFFHMYVAIYWRLCRHLLHLMSPKIAPHVLKHCRGILARFMVLRRAFLEILGWFLLFSVGYVAICCRFLSWNIGYAPLLRWVCRHSLPFSLPYFMSDPVMSPTVADIFSHLNFGFNTWFLSCMSPKIAAFWSWKGLHSPALIIDVAICCLRNCRNCVFWGMSPNIADIRFVSIFRFIPSKAVLCRHLLPLFLWIQTCCTIIMSPFIAAFRKHSDRMFLRDRGGYVAICCRFLWGNRGGILL